jgi:hypothetical protein
MFFSQLEELFQVLKENYASYRIKPECPAQQQQGGFSKDTLTKYGNDCISYFSKLLLAQIFHAAAPKNVRHLISHEDQSRLTVDDAYQIFFTEHHVETHKKVIRKRSFAWIATCTWCTPLEPTAQITSVLKLRLFLQFKSNQAKRSS